MDSAASDPEDRSDPEPLLADVTAIPVEQLVLSDNSVLVQVVHRMLAEYDQPQEIISAFSNYAE